MFCIEEVQGLFLSSFHNVSLFFLPSCLFMCLFHLLTSHVCFVCLLHQLHVLVLLALCAWLFTSIAYLSFAFVACLSFRLPCMLTLCACSCLLYLPCVLVSLAHFVICFTCCFATYSCLLHCFHLVLLTFTCFTTCDALPTP